MTLSTAHYTIQVHGRLDAGWMDWFEGLSLTMPAADRTVLAGPLPDQAALLGVLRRLHDLHLPILSVCRAEAP